MADARLQIIIDTMNKASGDLDKLKGDLQGVESESKKADKGVRGFGGGLKSMMGSVAVATAAIGGAVIAFKQVYSAAKEGADLQYAQTRFENLTEAVGTTADALMNDMREATSGMISDAELMASAGDLMALGLAKSHDEVVRLTTVAGALGMNMNQLVLTLTNQTTMRFDALGVSVDGFDEKVQALVDSGMDANEAFGEAFLQQAEEQIETVGSVADTTAGDFARLEAASKNLGDAIKKNLTDQLSGAVKAVAGWATKVSGYLNTLDEALRRGAITQDQYAEATLKVANFQWTMGEATEWAAGRIDIHNVALEEAAGVEDKFSRAAEAAALETDDLSTALDNAGGSARDAAGDMQKFGDKALFAMASTNLTADEAYDLAEAMGLIDQKTAYARTAISNYQQMLADGEIGLSEYNQLVEGLYNALDKLPGNVNVTINVLTRYRQEGEPPLFPGEPLTEDWVIDDDDYDKPTATGGAVYEGDPYRWQEYGYRGEQFVPSTSGYVLSRADAMRAVAMGKGRKHLATGGYLSTNDPTQNPGFPGDPRYGKFGKQPDYLNYLGYADPAILYPEEVPELPPQLELPPPPPPPPLDQLPHKPELDVMPKIPIDAQPKPQKPLITGTPSGPGHYWYGRPRDTVVASGGGKNYTIQYFYLTMPTSNSPTDVAMAFDLMQAYGGR